MHARFQLGFFSLRVRNFQPPRSAKALFPIAGIHLVDPYRAAGRRRMHELIVADVNTDMRDRAANRVEKHQIARLEVAGGDLLADPAHFRGATRQVHTQSVLEHIAYETAAIEARIRCVPTPAVTHAYHV